MVALTAMKVLLKRLEAGLRPLSPLTITTIALCWVLLLGLADYFSPPTVTLIAFYFLAVVFAGWGAGKWHACFISGVAAITTFTVYWVLQRGVPHSIWVAAWNNTARFVVFGFTGWLTAEMARLTRSLEQQVEQRTEQWRKEALEHKLTANRLSDTIQRFEQVINNITEVFWLTDVPKANVIYISPGYERVWGRKCEELYREPSSWLDAVHRADRDIVARRSATEQADGGYEVEYRIVRPDGAIRWIRDRAFPVRTPDGEVHRIAGLAQDITERKQARETLQMQAAILESMAEGVVVTDAQGIIVQMNPAAEKIWGYQRNEVLGKSASIFSALPEAEAGAVLREVLQALKTTGTWRGTFSNRRKDGALISCQALISRVEIHGQVFMVAVEQDVTDRLQAERALARKEELYRTLFELCPDGTLLEDTHGNILDANQAFCDLFGYAREALLGRNVRGLLPPENQGQVETNLAELRAGRALQHEVLNVRANGERLLMWLNEKPLALPDGRQGILVVGRDLTKIKRAETALREAHDHLELRVQERTAELQAANTALRRAEEAQRAQLAYIETLNQKLEQRVQERTAELRAANAALAESEQRYRSLVNNLNVGVYRNTPEPDGRFIHANPALARIHGYESTLEFERVSAIQLHQHAQERRVFLDVLLRLDTLHNYELHLKKKDGTPIYAAVNATVHRDSEGKAVWIDGVVEDITERKRAEQLLTEAVDLNQKMLAATTVGVSAYKASGECIFANEALARIVGGTLEDLLPANFRQAQSWRESGLIEMADEALSGGHAVSREVYCETRFGKKVWLDCHLASFVSNSRPHLLLMALDISERKQEEAFLQTQRDLGLSLSATSDVSAALKSFLEFALQMGGFDCGGVYLLDQAAQTLDLAEHRGISASFVRAVAHLGADSAQMKVVRQGRPVFSSYAEPGIPLDEVRLHEGLRAIAVLPLSHERQIIGALVLASRTMNDIPPRNRLVVEALAAQGAGAIARIQAEADRHRLERQLLEITDREQARIGQDIHDGLCQQVVSLAFDANSLARELSRLRRAQAPMARRMAKLADQTITETRQLARGLFPVRLESEGLPSALEELAKATRARFKVHCRFRSKGVVMVPNSTVATHLYRIAQEAVANAVKHSQARLISIDLATHDDQLWLRVEDDGQGLCAKAATRADGMGLHIMDYRARSVGGTLRVGPRPQGGTQVFCCVPR
jgi:PAS domain S-box-containing protein